MKNRLTGRLGAGTALLLAATLLAGCNGAAGTDPTTGATDGASAAEEELTGTLTIYAAASLQAAFTEVLAGFEAAYPGITVEPPVFDGSSTLVTQLSEGAAADVFASANEKNMNDLVAAGVTEGDPQLFATNTLVIAVAPGNPLGIGDLADLEGLDYAVCAPEVPCGSATTTLFDAAGLPLDAISQEQNVTAVAERVASGEIDAGLVYATDVASRADTLQAVVPSNASDVVNKYPITTLVGADPAGAAFIEYVLSDEGQALLADFGFGSP